MMLENKNYAYFQGEPVILAYSLSSFYDKKGEKYYIGSRSWYNFVLQETKDIKQLIGEKLVLSRNKPKEEIASAKKNS